MDEPQAAPAVSSTPQPATTTGWRRFLGIRWAIAAMLFLAAILNYIDRQTLSILAVTIQKDLGLSDAQYGDVANYFLMAYTISLLLSGRMVDYLGARFSMAIFITWWSVSNMATAWARSFTSLCVCRFSLGLGEAGNWPSSTKVVSEWFPAKERGVAIGFYTLGATVGATVAPVIVTWIVARYDWRFAFLVTGAIGLLWVVPWLVIYRRPREHPWISKEELNLVTSEAQVEAPNADGTEARWYHVLARKDVWLLMLGRMMTDPVWWFYQFWFAKYLVATRGFETKDLSITWCVYLAADIGSLGGGLLSAWLISRGKRPVASRLWAMLLCAMVMPLSPLVATSTSMVVCLGIAMVVVLAHLSWLTNISALLVDVVPTRFVATAFGVMAAGSALGGIAMNKAVAYLVENYSYTYWFVIMACLHPLAWLMLWGFKVGDKRDGGGGHG